jgi:hypothetical protein
MSHNVKLKKREKKEIEPRQRTASPRPSPRQPQTSTVSYSPSLVRDARPCHANAIPAGRRITTYTHLKNAVPINSLGQSGSILSPSPIPSSDFPSHAVPPPPRSANPPAPAVRASRVPDGHRLLRPTRGSVAWATPPLPFPNPALPLHRAAAGHSPPWRRRSSCC